MVEKNYMVVLSLLSVDISVQRSLLSCHLESVNPFIYSLSGGFVVYNKDSYNILIYQIYLGKIYWNGYWMN